MNLKRTGRFEKVKTLFKKALRSDSVNSAYFIILFSFLLSACSRGPTQEAAKDLCTGTKRPYQVKGSWYHPQNHYDYEEAGMASWYGPGFHDRPKSCGNKFNMHELSAAHKTLPIPSVVEVTNLENGKKLKLVVDDRGPFVKDRIIDLSKKAAIELGAHNKGLARVQVIGLPHESKALSDYLKQYGRYGQVPDGRTWSDIYYQEISGRNLSSSIECPPVVASPLAPQTSRFVKKQKPPALKSGPHLPLRTLKSIIYEHTEADNSPHEKTYNRDLDEEIEAILSPPDLSTSKKVYIEVGAFVQRKNAEGLKQRLSAIAPTVLYAPSLKNGHSFFSVKAGPYETEKEAKKVIEKLKNRGHYGASLSRH